MREYDVVLEVSVIRHAVVNLTKEDMSAYQHLIDEHRSLFLDLQLMASDFQSFQECSDQQIHLTKLILSRREKILKLQEAILHQISCELNRGK